MTGENKKSKSNTQLDELSEFIDSWPKWKQQILGAVSPEDIQQRYPIKKKAY